MSSTTNSSRLTLILPWMGLVIVCILDRISYLLMGDITIAPLLSILVLFVMAFRLKPGALVFWSIVFAGVSFFLISYGRNLGSSLISEKISEDSFSLSKTVVRSCSVLASGILCALVSRQRIRLASSASELLLILTSLPVAVVVADKSGAISFANKRASDEFAALSSGLLGSSFFSLFSDPTGNIIEKYSTLIESTNPATRECRLLLRKNLSKSFTTTLFVLHPAAGRIVVAVLQP